VKLWAGVDELFPENKNTQTVTSSNNECYGKPSSSPVIGLLWSLGIWEWVDES
jgi:hypothetical protein